MTEYRRYQGKSYMIWKGEAVAAGYEYPMLTKNRIIRLLPLQITNADESVQFWYDISGRQAFEDWVKLKKPGCNFLEKLITALAEAMEQAGEYLLHEDGISLEPDRIFVDAEEKEIAFCYMPYEKKDFKESLRGLMEYYLSHMEHGSREGTQKCYAVYEKCQQEHTMEDLLQLFYGTETEAEYLQEEEGCEETWDMPEREAGREKKRKRFPGDVIKRENGEEKKRRGFSGIAWKDMLLHKKKKTFAQEYAFEPEEYQSKSVTPTVFLGSETTQIIGELKYEGEGSGRNLPITGHVFLIGSQKGEVDGVILEDTISRIHARITKEGDCFYLEDMNSTNGTYRNGELLNYRERVQLEKNDRVIFAKEKYRFV